VLVCVDLWGLFNGGKEVFEEFIFSFNTWAATNSWGMKLISCGFGKSVTYLDLTIFEHEGQWHSKIYCKPTDVHAYLHPSSGHDAKVYRNIPFAVAGRLRRACSRLIDFHEEAKEYTDVHFARRDYPRSLLLEAFKQAENQSRAELLAPRPNRRPQKAMPFIFPYAAKSKADLAVKRNFKTLAADPTTAEVFTAPQMVCYRRGRTIKDVLVKADLQAYHEVAGCHKCTNSLCPFHEVLEETKEVVSLTNNSCWPIVNHITCETPHVIYLITCVKCWRQGVGESENGQERLKAYIAAANRTTIPRVRAGCSIEQHFEDPDHSLEDLRISLIYAVKGRSIPGIVKAVRTRFENLWIRRLGAGINEGGLNTRRQWRASFPTGPPPKRRRVTSQ
jgi:hypothetical protein